MATTSQEEAGQEGSTNQLRPLGRRRRFLYYSSELEADSNPSELK